MLIILKLILTKNIMKKLLFIILAGVFFSCKNTQPQEKEVKQEIKKISKLETLYSLPKDSIYDFYDLSNDSIKEFPDLSEYSIKMLDLSNNQIDSLVIKRLPKNIEDLNVSNNKFKGEVSIDLSLKKMNFSHNKITSFYSGKHIAKIILSHNKLEKVIFNYFDFDFLDISQNPNLSNRVDFYPNRIDTIIYHNIANKKKLIHRSDGIIVE